MAKKSTPPSFIESLANEILSKYRRLDTVLSHAPSKGSYHESILRDMIGSYLPLTFSVGEGFVINNNGETSSQLDVLVVDNLDPRAYGFKNNNFFVASNIAVTSFGEVKTHCTKKDFINSFHKLVSSSLILGGDNSARVTSFLFCYDAHASKKTFTKWADIAISKFPEKANSWNYPDYIFCLKKEVFLERKPIKGGFQYWSATGKKQNSKIIPQLILERIFQCITNGCGRIRQIQGINLIDR